MKKFILTGLLSLPLIFLAQINKQSPQQLKEKAIKTEQKQSLVKPKVISDSKDYGLIKAEGRLAHYEIISNEGKIVSIEKTTYSKTGSVTSSTLTPCDVVPPGTIASFSPADDVTSGLLSLPFTFCFYGNNYTQVRMSANGNIQFPPTNNTAFSSTGFPVANDVMIAPFWADVDIRGTGSCTYDVYPTYAVFSWNNVGYYNQKTDLKNDFQMVITDGLDPILPPGKNVGFYYGSMQWTTGDASSGVGGFPSPTITPAIPATVGANAGNGVDYFLIGRFGQSGSFYDGPLGVNDGVSWLNGKRFYFNVCPPTGANNEPIPTLIGYCDTLKVCGNDTLFVKNTFIAPEVSQSVTVTATAPTLGSSFTYSILPNTNSTDIYMIVDGNTAPAGYHTVTMSATDNGTPPLTSNQSFIIYVNQSSVNNLNGTLVITPTVGACPGQTVSVSVNVSGGTPDSYLWSNNATTSTATFTTVVAADSLIFVTLQSGQCKKTITGDININPVPVASISGNLSYCNGNASSTVLTATNTLNPVSQGPHTYTWSATTGTLSSSNTASTSVNGGVYTVTVTNQFGCKSIATTSVVMNDSPKYTLTSSNAISGGSVYCVNQDTARLALNFGTGTTASCGLANSPCVVSNTIQVGAGTANATGSAITPFVSFWKSSRHQYLFRASELLAAGVQPGKISSIAFNLGTISSETFYPDFTVKIKCTSATTVGSSFDNVGLNQVYLANTTINTGWNQLTFSQNYVWDGVSNLLIDVCHGLTSGIPSNSQVKYTATTYNSVIGDYDSGSGSLCGATGFPLTSVNRPNIIFGNCLAQQTGSQFNVVVTPTTGVVVPAAHDSIRIDLPSTSGTTCYTVSLINPIGNCSKDTVICVNALQGVTQGTLSINSTSVCPSGTVTLSASGALTSYTIQYIDDAGVQTTTLSPVTFTAPSTIGAYTYTLLATGACGGPLTSFTNTLNVVQGVTQATLAVSDNTVCPGSNITLSALGSLASYTISYVDASGSPQTSVNNPATFTPESTTSPVFGIHTYSITAQGFCNGPITVFTNTVDVVQGVTSATLVSTPSVVCIGSPVTLTANGSLSTYTISYNNGSLVNSVNNSATFNTAISGLNVYTLTAQGLCSAPITNFTTSVMVNSLATLTIAPMANVTKCLNSSVTLTANVLPASTSYSYNWSPSVGTFTNNTYSSSAIVTTTYVVTVNGFCANTATASVVVSNYPNDMNVQIIDSASVCANTELVLHSLTTGGRPPYTYNWTILPNTNSVGSLSNLNTTAPSSEGTYTIMVLSTDDCGFTDFDNQVVVVLPSCEIVIANIITPNEDGANDFFKIKNIEYHPNSSLTIFDRWGKKVYENKNYANEWKADGLNDGTYFYVLDVPDDKKYNGFVQVAR